MLVATIMAGDYCEWLTVLREIDEMGDVLTSEFFWGIVVGVLLSIAGAYSGTKFGLRAQNDDFRNRQRDFAREIVSETAKLIEELDKHRSRARVIHHDFLNMLDVEINVYGRNRENFILLDGEARKHLLNFMREVALKQTEIRQSLHLFDEFNRGHSASMNNIEELKSKQNADMALKMAHEKADKLVELGRTAPSL